ncbi:alpha/beta hydrolase [Microbulbifer hydrolyticus]|uniref:Alpha-beta hydrolase superfamily lysophospholipase n=1 Tax=Microbulbifer hydrolyticus TaxID=48074 RepID=A0A6P1TA50_9GAMM|nr:alpha/beta hydrolase [Microbulbifer hydrolyticus]MBB5213188.1 alpha-beta hydrolase superfamily lysophospholipase [Microbulbifer hydrolyticus]QHQ38543.1 alpha/beta fold hydrolase [Microbulbifer hydrolyticus]
MYFESRDIRLHYRRWWVENALGVVVVSHGLGEHSGRYRLLARYLNAHGYSVYALDHFGHGQSPGRRGDIEEFTLYSTDLSHFIHLARHENPGQSIHLLGHSMGGVIACDALVSAGSEPLVDSLVLSAPAFTGGNEPGVVEVGLIRLLARIAPGLPLSNRLDSRWISRDPEVVEAYRADDLVHDRVTPRWFLGYRKVRDRLLAHPEAIQTPCLTLLPEADYLVDPDVSRAWHESLEGSGHCLCTFAGAYHEVFNDPDLAEQAMESLLEHLTEHSAPSTQGVLPEQLRAGA